MSLRELIARTDFTNFWSKVGKNEADPNACWQWKAAKNAKGYGMWKVHKKHFGAHRLSFQLLVSEIPKGKQIDHLCRNTSCVNPRHLEVVTCRENVLRGNSFAGINARKKFCVRGHPLSGDNLRISGVRKMRRCATCVHMH